MSRTCVEVTTDGIDERPRILVTTDGPQGRGHVGVRVLAVSSGRVRVALVAEGALLVAGDEVALGMRVGAGVRLDVVEPAGTVAYDMRGGRAQWSVDLAVAATGSLVWHGEPFVVSTGAQVQRRVHVNLEEGAQVALRDVCVLGRSGETGGLLRQRFRAFVAGEPLLAEDLCLDGARPRPGVLGSYRVMDTVTVLGRRAARIPSPPGSQRLELQGEGTVLRYLGAAAHTSSLESTWKAAA